MDVFGRVLADPRAESLSDELKADIRLISSGDPGLGDALLTMGMALAAGAGIDREAYMKSSVDFVFELIQKNPGRNLSDIVMDPNFLR